MELTHRLSFLELKPARSVHFGQAGRIHYLNFYIDGTPLREQLSFVAEDESVFGPGALLKEWAKSDPQGAEAVALQEAVASYSRSMQEGRLAEPSRLGYGSITAQQEALQEMLLRGESPAAQRRCRLFGCPGCPCHGLSAIIELVDGCFVWHSFQSQYAAGPTTIALGGGPFFFEREHYIETLENALNHPLDQ